MREEMMKFWLNWRDAGQGDKGVAQLLALGPERPKTCQPWAERSAALGFRILIGFALKGAKQTRSQQPKSMQQLSPISIPDDSLIPEPLPRP
jgi:hypothetical protein